LTSLLFIKSMLRMKKTGVTAEIQMILRPSDDARFPKIKSLVRLTVCVRGRNACAKTCMKPRRSVSGKNVPLNRNIGVMNRNPGQSKKSIFGARDVKHSAIAENISPATKATSGISRNIGLVTRPKAAITQDDAGAD
jgi:hypothetical protein